MDDCHSWGFIQTGVWLSGSVWAHVSLYCHVHWVQLLWPCSFNLQEKRRPGPKSILKRWCPMHERKWQPWRMPILCACRYVTTWAWTYKERGAAQCLWCLSLLQCQGSSICSCLSSASLSPFTKASRAVFPFLTSCSWSHTVILMAFMLCYYCYVREVIATAVRVEPLSPAFSCTGFRSF